MADNVPKLGEIITGEAERDAVHVAVAPLIAASILAPGAHVTKEGSLTAPGKGIGVVDPFLHDSVKPGEKFYVFLYPGSAIGLRHVYRHPELDADLIRRETIEALAGPSKKRLTEVAEAMGVTYEAMMEGVETYLRTGESLTTDGWAQMNPEPTDDFWEHYEMVTGKVIDEAIRKKAQDEIFSCAC